MFSLLRPHLRVMPGDPRAAPTSAATSAYRQFFGARLKDQYGDHYYLIVSIFNGVVLAVAAVALLALFSSNVSGVFKANGLALWLGAFASLVATYNGAMVDSMVITAPPNPVEIVIPFAFSLLECAAFAVLIPLTPGGGSAPLPPAAQLAHLRWWLLIEVAVSITGLVLPWSTPRPTASTW